jgi:hypothetical protein
MVRFQGIRITQREVLALTILGSLAVGQEILSQLERVLISTVLLYGFVFSYDKILQYRETAQVIVTALYSIDCPVQAKNHMLGLLHDGVDRKDIEIFRKITIRISEHLGLRFKNEPIPVPDVPVWREAPNGLDQHPQHDSVQRADVNG